VFRCVVSIRAPFAMLVLKTGVAHLLTRFSSTLHCRKSTGGNKHHHNKVHPELSGFKPRRMLRIGFGHHFSRVKSGASNFRYQKVSFVRYSCYSRDKILERLFFFVILFFLVKSRITCLAVLRMVPRFCNNP